MVDGVRYKTYEEWLGTVPDEFRNDVLWQMEVYRLALFAVDIAWPDVSKLVKDKRTVGLADQLCRSVGSVSSNISEGYSRSSKRDQTRFYEYALGSARESRGWYYKGRHVLTNDVSLHRIRILTQIIRLLLTIIPKNRYADLKESPTEYSIVPHNLLDDIPFT